MSIPSLNWQAAHAWLLAHEGYWVLGTVALFVVGLVLLGRPKPEKPWRVRSRPLLTENELEFCHRLEDALPEFLVMVQVSMGSFSRCTTIRRRHSRTAQTWSISTSSRSF